MNAGEQNVDLRQPDQIFAARDAGDIHRARQVIGRELHLRVGVNPLADRAQRLRR